MKKLDKKIAVIGACGYVGHAMSEFFCRHYDLYLYDNVFNNEPPPEPGYSGTHSSLGHIVKTKEEVNQCDVAVVCVPTPVAEDGSCDTSIVEEVVDWLETPHILIKSTVEPGTTDRLIQKTGKNIVFSPEYCGESSYWSPYAWDRNVVESPWFTFGGDSKETSFYVDLYMPIGGPTKKYVQTSAKAAELAKYMENTFYASKVTFCYEMANVCNQSGVDYNEVRSLFLQDPRVNPMHTAVFANNTHPFGGKCYPKDVQALVAYAKKIGYEPGFLQEILNSNERIGKYREGEK